MAEHDATRNEESAFAVMGLTPDAGMATAHPGPARGLQRDGTRNDEQTDAHSEPPGGHAAGDTRPTLLHSSTHSAARMDPAPAEEGNVTDDDSGDSAPVHDVGSGAATHGHRLALPDGWNGPLQAHNIVSFTVGGRARTGRAGPRNRGRQTRTPVHEVWQQAICALRVLRRSTLPPLLAQMLR